VGLARRAHALPTELSGGERQRVAIARALVNRPSLLLCDEPTGNLDTSTTEELTDLLSTLHEQGATLLVITHNPVVAARAERQIRIRDGSLSERGLSLPQDPELPEGPWVEEDPPTREVPGARHGERNGGSHARPGG
jgi:putative ABC transport system ATP-binding protein